MTAKTERYSIWFRPKGEEAERLQALISKLAKSYGGSVFVPHVTLVGNMYLTSEEVAAESQRLDDLAQSMSRFTVTLEEYGFMNEKERCFYILAKPMQIDQIYEQAMELYPQINDEYFRAMPHLSLLYGDYPESTKHAIINSNPLSPISFEAESFDLYLTEGYASTWHQIHSARLH